MTQSKFMLKAGKLILDKDEYQSYEYLLKEREIFGEVFPEYSDERRRLLQSMSSEIYKIENKILDWVCYPVYISIIVTIAIIVF